MVLNPRASPGPKIPMCSVAETLEHKRQSSVN